MLTPNRSKSLEIPLVLDRKFANSDAEMTESKSNLPPSDHDGKHTQSPSESGNLWKTGLLLAGSAIFGGLAVAFWHRHTLLNMRRAAAEDRPVPRPAPPEDDVIY